MSKLQEPVAICDRLGYSVADPLFKAANCDLERLHSDASSVVSRSRKSGGNRPGFRLTCSLSRLVGTP
jgi:hypothetical protein